MKSLDDVRSLTEGPAARRVLLAAEATVGVLAGGYLLLFLVLAWFRISYPFEIEWLEGSVVDVVARLLAGDKIYVEPSIEFASHGYTPLYYYLSALASLILGVGFLPLRLVSFVSIIGVFALIFLFVRRETLSSFWGLVAAGLFAATFRIGGAWFDVARVDSLFLFWLMAGLYVSRFFRASAATYALAALLFFLAYFTKQSALGVAVCVQAYFVLVDRRRAPVFGIVLAAGVVGSVLILDRIHDGWYFYYTTKLISQHPLVSGFSLLFWRFDVLRPLPLACVLSLALLARHVAERRREALFHPLAAAGLIGVAWSSRMHLGGYANVVLPAYLAFAILFTLALRRALLWLEHLPAARRAPATLALHLVAAVQLLMLTYDPVAQVPTQADRAAGEALLQRIRAVDGEVYLPFHGFLGRMAGKRSYGHHHCFGDVYRGSGTEIQQALTANINEAFRQKRFAAVFWDFGKIRFEDMRENYERLPGRIFDDKEVFRPVTGARMRPEIVFVPRE